MESIGYLLCQVVVGLGALVIFLASVFLIYSERVGLARHNFRKRRGTVSGNKSVGRVNKILYRFNAVAMLFLLARSVDPVGVLDIYAPWVVDLCAYNASLCFVIILSVVIYYGLETTYVVAKQTMPTTLKTAFFVNMAQAFVATEACVIAHNWTQQEKYTYSPVLFSLALSLVFMLSAFNVNSYRLHQTVQKLRNYIGDDRRSGSSSGGDFALALRKLRRLQLITFILGFISCVLELYLGYDAIIDNTSAAEKHDPDSFDLDLVLFYIIQLFLGIVTLAYSWIPIDDLQGDPLSASELSPIRTSAIVSRTSISSTPMVVTES